ncbi:MAG: DNA repair exonuclease [Planctomycetota bacterium]|nr:MAG: DNA repair exonuclease [Planctomycetota bacterium]
MVRFIHTGDWHIGVRRSFLAEKQKEWDRFRWKAMEGILRKAEEKEADFILIAGDLFDHNQISESYINQAFNLLHRSPCPVMILPGNHDPLTYDSIYRQPQWKKSTLLHVFFDSQPWQPPNLPEVVIHPAPVFQKSSKKDPAEFIKGIENKINIGLAHGNLMIPGKVEDSNFPIHPERAEIASLDYLALGEWHTWLEWKDSKGVVRTLYPGTPEATNFGEKEPGFIAFVEIGGPGEAPKIEKIPVSTLKWEKLEFNLQNHGGVECLKEKVFSFEDSSKTLLQILSQGFLTAKERTILESKLLEWKELFFYFSMPLEKVHLKPSPEELREISHKGGILGRMGEVLLSFEDKDQKREWKGEIPENIGKNLENPEIREECWLKIYQILEKLGDMA